MFHSKVAWENFLAGKLKHKAVEIFAREKKDKSTGGKPLGGKHLVSNFWSYLEQNQYIRYSDTVSTNQY